MSDDWRLRVDFHETGRAAELRDRLEATDLEHELASQWGDRVAVSGDGPEVFLYADSRAQAERADSLIRKLAGELGWQLDTELKRWHPAAEEWRDPDEQLPASGTEQAGEHAAAIAQEREESVIAGHPEYEVRIECRSHSDARRLADRLEAEGIPTARRWRYLVVGANDEDAAAALAERIRAEAPPDALVVSEASPQAVSEAMPGNPFAIFGGLGG